MKNMKRILSFMLIFFMIFTMMPEVAMANELSEDPAEEVMMEEPEIAEPTTDAEELPESASEEVFGETNTLSLAAAPATQAEMSTITKNQSVALDTSKFYTIFHLDCGRNYFSVQQIKNIIDEMAKDGYNTLELAVGNDALRLVLDDMSVTANGKTYDSTTITDALKSGNSSYRNNGTNQLTQSEMDTIIAYANSKNIAIIPLVNAPGHANTMLAIMKAVGISNPSYSNDPRTIDVRNAEAVNFSLALVNKYIQYFASKGCKIFNMGADEYANTSYSSGSMGFGHLQSAGEYGYYADYVNNMAAQIQNAGMTAMAFNDGIYFNSKTTASFDSNIAIAYWSSGFGSYIPAPASFLANKGHKIINTNDGWYYVVGRTTQGYGYNSAMNAAKNTKVTDIPGSNDPTAYGAMMCLWYDESATYEEAKVKTLLSTLAENNASYFVVNPETPDATDLYEMTDSTESITVNTEESKTPLTSVTMEPATVNSINTNYVAYDVTINNGEYTGKAKVTIPLTDDLKSADKLVGFVVNKDNTITTVAGNKTSDGNAFTFEAPHFSTVGVMEDDTPAADVKNTVNVELEVGETSTTYKEESGAYTSGTGLNSSIATAVITPVSTTGQVTTNNITSTNSISSTQKYLLVNNAASKTLTDTTSSNGLALDGTVSNTDGKGGEIWSIIQTNGGYYIVDENGKYLTIGNGTAAIVDEPHVLALSYTSSTRRWQISETVTTTNTSTVEEQVSLNYDSNGYSTYTNGDYYIKVNGENRTITKIECTRTGRGTLFPSYKYSWKVYYSSSQYQTYSENPITIYTQKTTTDTNTNTYYLNNNSGQGVYASGYTTGNSDTNSRWNIYSVTATEDVNSTDVQFTGVNTGTTSMVVGETQYNITVKRKNVTDSVLIGSANSYTDTTASSATVISGGEYVDVNTSGNTITITGKSVGTAVIQTNNCTYTIKVNNEDISGVSPVTVYFWITNNTITANNATSKRINASDEGVHSAQGAKIADLLPEYGTHGSDKVHYWKTVCHSSSEKQTSLGTNQTLSGTTFNYIRYYNGAWAYSVDGSDWVSIGSGYVLDAYYLQVTTVTNEVTTEVVDWGVDYSTYTDSNYVMLDYSVKYESGDETPSTFPVSGKTLGFHCNYNSDLNKTVFKYNSTYYRRIGMIRAAETDDYEVYMITLTPTSDAGGDRSTSGCKYNTSYKYQGTEVVAWAATAEDFENSGLEKYTSFSNNFKYSEGGDPVVSGLEILNRTGLKVTYYVRAKVTEDSLTVKYVDDTTGTEFYNYGIVVNKGTTFKTNIGLNNNKAVENGDVVNSLGKNQTVSSDLSTMPAIPAAYRYSEYSVKSLERSVDGKTVTIHYTFNNTHSFVVDFGLSLHISTTDLGISGDWTSATVTGAKYGEAIAVKGEGVTYIPTQVLKGVEQLNLVLTGNQGSATHIIYIYPATTVYYEEGFADYTGTWTGNANKGSGTQTTSEVKTEKASTAAVYGYDAKYAAETTGPSNGTQATSEVGGDKAVFAFTGTGVDIYANSTPTTGIVSAAIRTAEGKAVKFISIKTKLVNGTTIATDEQNVNGYNIPIATIKDLPYGSYTVTITHTSDATVNIDGFRVHGTLPTNDKVYVNDLEDNPTYIELRNEALAAYNVDAAGKCDQVYGGDSATVSIVSNTADYSEETVQDILTNGPKNEIYLQPNQSIVFNVATNRQVQVGMKALNAATSYSINNGTSMNLISSTDMFYTISAGQTAIKNTGSGILSLTKLKICDEPGAALVPMSADAVIAATNVEATPEYADATLKVNLTDYTGKKVAETTLAANGILGEEYTFAAADIQAAAEAVLPAGYGLLAVEDDASVTYGDTEEITLTAGKVATLVVTYKRGTKVVGTATLTHVQTNSDKKTTFQPAEIKAAGPDGYVVISILGTSVKYGSTTKINASAR